MLNAIRYLETLGAAPFGDDAAFAGDGLLEGLPAPLRDALVARDAAALAVLLGARARMQGYITCPGDDEPPREDEEDEDDEDCEDGADEGEDGPDRDGAATPG